MSTSAAHTCEESVPTEDSTVGAFLRHILPLPVRHAVSPHCGGEAKTQYAFSGKGEVGSYTRMTDAPTGFDESAPYTVALIKLQEGPLVTAQLTDLGDKPVEIGMPVEMVTRKLRSDGDERGMLVYG